MMAAAEQGAKERMSWGGGGVGAASTAALQFSLTDYHQQRGVQMAREEQYAEAVKREEEKRHALHREQIIYKLHNAEPEVTNSPSPLGLQQSTMCGPDGNVFKAPALPSHHQQQHSPYQRPKGSIRSPPGVVVAASGHQAKLKTAAQTPTNSYGQPPMPMMNGAMSTAAAAMRASGMSTPGYTPLSMSANMTPQQMAIMRQQQTLFYQQQQQAHLRQLQPGAANRRVAAVYEQQQPRYAPMHPATSAQQQHQFNAAAQLQAQQQQQQAAAAAAASHHMVNGGAGWPYGMPRTPQPYASSSMINGAPVPPHHPYVMADGSGGAAYLAHQHPSTSLTGYTPTNSAMHPNGCNAMPTSSSTSPFANPAGHPSRGHTPIAAQPPSSTLSHHASPQAAAAAAAGIHPNFDAAPLRQFASSTTPQPMASGPSNGAMLNGYTTSQFGAPMFAANAMPPPPPAAVDKPPTDLNFNSAANFDTSNGTISSPPSNAATTSRVPSLDPAAATASGTRVDDRSFFAHYPDAASCPPSLDVDELDIGALDVHPFSGITELEPGSQKWHQYCEGLDGSTADFAQLLGNFPVTS